MRKSHMEFQNMNNYKTDKGISDFENQENNKLCINLWDVETNMNRLERVVNYVYAYNVAVKDIQDSKDLEPQSLITCPQLYDWLKWQEAIQSDLNSLAKHEIFGPIVQMPNLIKCFSCKWILCLKWENEIQRYKSCLVAQ